MAKNAPLVNPIPIYRSRPPGPIPGADLQGPHGECPPAFCCRVRVEPARLRFLAESAGFPLTMSSTTPEAAGQTASVKVWSGGRHASAEALVEEEDPDVYEVAIHFTDFHIPHHEHVVLADNIEHYGTYAFHVETEQPVELVVQTNDSYHSPEEGYREGRPVENGLLFTPEGHARHTEEPFKCELWGRIRMRVESTE
jgi:hypothetical protein